MLKDREGNVITISKKTENQHIKVLGRSGCGKTFWVCHYIEEKMKEQNFLILDFSGSYTESELDKNRFLPIKREHFQSYNLKEHGMDLVLNRKYAVDIITDSILATLQIRSLYQKPILQEACERTFEKNTYFSFEVLYEMICKLQRLKENTDIVKHSRVLMERMDLLKDVDTLHIGLGEKSVIPMNCIIEVSDFSSRKRMLLSQILLEIFWGMIRHDPVENLHIVLDEFQLLRLKGSAIEAMLREGRKFQVGLILLTQYLKPDNIDLLEQAATALYFRPNDRNLKYVAQMLNPIEDKLWVPMLKNLQIGQCIMDGKFEVNGKEARNCRPVICNVNVPEQQRFVKNESL